MRLQKKSISKVNFLDILRRRKTTLINFLDESGIVSYSLLVSRCNSMGVNPPTEKQFLEAKGEQITQDVSSPTEGIVVLTPPDIIVETTGKADLTVETEFQSIYVPPQYPKKKKPITKYSKNIIHLKEEEEEVQIKIED